MIETKKGYERLEGLLIEDQNNGLFSKVHYGHFDYALDSDLWPFPEPFHEDFWEIIIPMVELLDSNKLDIVDGSRLKTKPKNMPFINYIGNIFFGFIASLFFLRLFLDLHSGMRVYRKTTLDEFTWREKEPALPVELLLMMQKRKKKIGIYFIDYNER